MLSILIVDDETYVCDGITQNIPWHELGIQSVHQAHTGREGLQLALQLKPDILLSDVRMPHMDGLVMASALQENGIQPQIIFMSAYSELSYYKKALKLAAFIRSSTGRSCTSPDKTALFIRTLTIFCIFVSMSVIDSSENNTHQMLAALFSASLGYSWMRKKEPWQQPCGGLEATVYLYR